MSLVVGCRADDGEKHQLDINFLLYHKAKLYSAADDGKIKVWTSDLTKLAEVQAHSCSVYCLAANNDTLFSCSNDGTVKMFELDTLKEKNVLINENDVEFYKLWMADNGLLYVGDNEGNIRIFKEGKVYGKINIAESIKDMIVSDRYLFTVKDVDMVITDLKIEAEKIQFSTLKVYPGRAPITLLGDSMVGFSSREGKDINIIENNHQSHFKEVTKVKGAHEKIINALAGAKWNNKAVLFSGGWDKAIKKWNIEGNVVKMAGSVDVEIVINAIAIGDKNEIYVGGGDGHLVRVEV